MNNKKFKSFVVYKDEKGNFNHDIRTKSISDLPSGDVLVRVHYSSLNYKDALSAIGNRGVTRHYPHTPGIDAAGIVKRSDSKLFKEGDKVIVTSYDLGMNTSGGWSEFVRVPKDWVVHLPQGMTLRESMFYGTAGFTAGLAFDKLLDYGITPEMGPVLVTGASGGLGSIAVALLSSKDFRVIAVTGKDHAQEYLYQLGAKDIISHQDAIDKTSKPMLSGRWAGVIDSVGGEILETAIKRTLSRGAVVSCGNAASAHLEITVYPFILRGIALFGVDSQNTQMRLRRKIWEKLSSEWKLRKIEKIGSVCNLDNLQKEINKILEGEQIGRKVVKLIS